MYCRDTYSQSQWCLVITGFTVVISSANSVQLSLHDAVEKINLCPMYDVAFTKPRHQHNKGLANAESEPEQKSAGHSFVGRSDQVVKEIWVACPSPAYIPVSVISKQNPTCLLGKWTHKRILLITGEWYVFIYSNLVQITAQQMKL